jgi:PAS domain S-box-containing protein
LSCNKIILQTLNAKEDQLIGKSVVEVIQDPIRENGQTFVFDERPVLKAIRSKKPIEGLVMGIKHPVTRERIWMMMNINPIVDENGKIMHVITTLTDITERKKLELKLVQDEVSQQKLLTRATLEGQEKERREIGKELHDNIGQQLTTTKLYLDLAKSTADDETMELICLALKSISDVINDVRGISRSLTPHTLGDLGLVESICDLIETLHRTQSISVKLNYAEFDEDVVSDTQKLMLFRIIQEQLNNVVKHAMAKTVRIYLKNQSPLLSLEIADDGKGFDSNKIRRGLGLTNIRNRAELFGGKVDIITSEGAGCTLRITVPNPVKNTE